MYRCDKCVYLCVCVHVHIHLWSIWKVRSEIHLILIHLRTSHYLGLSCWLYFVCVYECVCVCVCVCVYLVTQLCLTFCDPMDCSLPAAPLSMESSKHEYWSGFPFPTPGDLLNRGFKSASLASPALAGGFFTTEPPGKPQLYSRSQQTYWWHWTASNPAPFCSLHIYRLEMQKHYLPRSQYRQTVERQALEFCLARDQVPGASLVVQW